MLYTAIFLLLCKTNASGAARDVHIKYTLKGLGIALANNNNETRRNNKKKINHSLADTPQGLYVQRTDAVVVVDGVGDTIYVWQRRTLKKSTRCHGCDSYAIYMQYIYIYR